MSGTRGVLGATACPNRSDRSDCGRRRRSRTLDDEARMRRAARCRRPPGSGAILSARVLRVASDVELDERRVAGLARRAPEALPPSGERGVSTSPARRARGRRRARRTKAADPTTFVGDWTSTLSRAGARKLASASICSARRDSPFENAQLFICFAPTALPATTARIAIAIQPKRRCFPVCGAPPPGAAGKVDRGHRLSPPRLEGRVRS